MNSDPRERQRKSYILMRVIYDLGMALIILSVALVMLLGDKLGNNALQNFITHLDPTIRYMFGGLCVLYGGFRLYRGLKHEY